MVGAAGKGCLVYELMIDEVRTWQFCQNEKKSWAIAFTISEAMHDTQIHDR